MIVIGLTGSIGTGKSSVAAQLARLGVKIIDLDALAREAVAPGSEGLAQVVRRFGNRIVNDQGGLDRAALRRVIFSDRQAKADLESILHPIIARMRNDIIARWRSSDPEAVVVEDAPLLFEAGLEARFDKIVVVYADRESQLDRLMRRDRISRSEAEKAIASQIDVGEKVKKADYVIDNSGAEEATRGQVEGLYRRWREEAGDKGAGGEGIRIDLGTGCGGLG